MKSPRSLAFITAAFAIAAAGVSISEPALALEQSFTFTQAGFSGGGAVQGSLVVDDLNNDGDIMSFYGELLSFSMHFSGDAFVPSFSIGLEELGALNWRLGSPWLGDETLRRGTEGLVSDYTLGLPFSYVSGFGTTHAPGGLVVDLSRGLVSTTMQALSVSAVPEPSGHALFAAGLAVLGALVRRRAAR